MISLTSPVKTRAHDWPAGAKLLALCAATLVLFLIRHPVPHLMALLFVIALYRLPGITFFRSGLRTLRVLWPFVILVAIYHVLTQTMDEGIVIILRMITAVGLANLVTMTTKLSDMIAVLRLLTTPLRAIGLKSDYLETAIALVVRFTPVLLGKGQHLSDAWRARSTRRPGWRIVLPFTVLALDDADHVAEALRARGGFDAKKE